MSKWGSQNLFYIGMTNYLCDRSQNVQIDDKKSLLDHSHFRVPQGSILGLLLFNIYTSDPRDSISCYQYADGTTLYKQLVRQRSRTKCSWVFNNSLNHMASWSLKSNLALNPVKTKSMLLLTSQMNLKQNDHVEDIANASYGVLGVAKIKTFYRLPPT